jgi:hypothetical protein
VADHWALTPEPYVEGGLVLHGFKAEEDAERFASLHLPDWVARPVGAREEGHRAICAECGTNWPCHHRQVESEASAILFNSQYACHVCTKSTMGSLSIRVPAAGDLGQDLRFHGRQGKCRNAAVKLLEELGRDEELQKLHAEEQRRKDFAAYCKKRKAEYRARLRAAVLKEAEAEQERASAGAAT